MGSVGSIDSSGREKDLRVCGASCPNCRHSLDNRGWFRRNRFHFRKFHEQFFNLALLMRLGQAGLSHDSILSRCGKKEADRLHLLQGTICENLVTFERNQCFQYVPSLISIICVTEPVEASLHCVTDITDSCML